MLHAHDGRTLSELCEFLDMTRQGDTIDREPSKLIEAVSGGWPKLLSNLKSLLETGSIALEEPYPAAAA